MAGDPNKVNPKDGGGTTAPADKPVEQAEADKPITAATVQADRTADNQQAFKDLNKPVGDTPKSLVGDNGTDAVIVDSEAGDAGTKQSQLPDAYKKSIEGLNPAAKADFEKRMADIDVSTLTGALTPEMLANAVKTANSRGENLPSGLFTSFEAKQSNAASRAKGDVPPTARSATPANGDTPLDTPADGAAVTRDRAQEAATRNAELTALAQARAANPEMTEAQLQAQIRGSAKNAESDVLKAQYDAAKATPNKDFKTHLDPPQTLSFRSPDGFQTFAAVTDVTTRAESDGSINSTIATADGKEYQQILKPNTAPDSLKQIGQYTEITDANGKKTGTGVWERFENGDTSKSSIASFKDETGTWQRGQGEKSNEWTKIGADGQAELDANKKPITFKGNVELLDNKTTIRKTDSTSGQITTNRADGSSTREIPGGFGGVDGKEQYSAYTIEKSADGKISVNRDIPLLEKPFTSDSKDPKYKVEVGKNGELTFTDWQGVNVIAPNGDVTLKFSSAPGKDQTGVMEATTGRGADGKPEMKSITFAPGTKITGDKPGVQQDMSGTWTRSADGTTWTNGDKQFTGDFSITGGINNGQFKVIDSKQDSVTTYQQDGSSEAKFKNGREVSRAADGSTVERVPLSKEDAALKVGPGHETHDLTEITRTDKTGKVTKAWEIAEPDPDKAGPANTYIGKIQDENGRNWVRQGGSDSLQWQEVDASGNAKPGDNGEPSTFTGNFELTKREGQPGEGFTLRKTFGSGEPDFTVDYKPDGNITITSKEFPMLGYNTDASYGMGVTRGENGDLKITSANMVDQLTLKANGDVSATNLLQHPGGMQAVTEGFDSKGNKEVKQVTFDGSVNKDLEGTWKRTGGADSTTWTQVGADGKPTGKTYNGDIVMNSRLTGDLQVSNYDKHTTESYAALGTWSKSEQFESDNKTLKSSTERFVDGATTKHDILTTDEVQKQIANGGLDKSVADAIKAGKQVDKVTITDANGQKVTTLEVVDGQSRYVAQMTGPTGTWIREGGESSNSWKGATATADGAAFKETGSKFYGDVQRNGRITTLTNDRDNQVTRFDSDGSWTQELLTEKTTVNSDLSMTSEKSPAYSIRHTNDGTTTVTDTHSGITYSSRDGGNRKLQVDDKGNLKFTDSDGAKITLKPDGSREMVGVKGDTMITDQGGRMRQELDKDGKVVADYGYVQQGDKVVLNAFQNSSGSWEMTQLANGKQKWDMISGANGVSVSLEADKVYINPDNSFVIENGNSRTVRKLDGTEITSTYSDPDSSGERTTRVSVGTRDGDKVNEAYSLVTRTSRDGSVLSQQLDTKSGVFKAGKDNVWQEFKKNPDGTLSEKVGEKWTGRISIGDDGALTKVSYTTETDDNGKAKEKVRDVHKLYSDGTSDQNFTNGAYVRRDVDGDVTYRKEAGGETISVDYTKNADGKKEILGFTQGDTYWQYNQQTGKFSAREAKDHSKTISNGDSFTNVSIDMKSGDVVRRNLITNDVNISQVDGTTRLEKNDGTVIITDKGGRPLQWTIPNKSDYKLTYDDGGNLVKLEGYNVGADGKKEPVVVVDKDLADRPPGALVGDNLKINGFGDRYLSMDDLGKPPHKLEIYADMTVREYSSTDAEAAKSGKPLQVIRVDNPDGTTVVAKDYATFGRPMPTAEQLKQRPGAKPDSKVIQVDQIIAAPKTDQERAIALGEPFPPNQIPQELTNDTRSVIYRDGDKLVQQFSTGASQEFKDITVDGNQVRVLTSTTDSTGVRADYTFGDVKNPTTVTSILRSDKNGIPLSRLDRNVETMAVTMTTFSPKIDAKTGKIAVDADGKSIYEANKPEPLKDFKVSDGKIRIMYPDAQGNPKLIDIIDQKSGTMLSIGKDRSRTDFDNLGRMTQKVDASGATFTFEYKGNETVPYKLMNTEGNWVRQDPKNQDGTPGPVDLNGNTTWIEAKTGAKWEGSVSTAGGEYKFKSADGNLTRHLNDGSDEILASNGTSKIVKDGRTLSSIDTAGNTTKYNYEGDSKSPSSFVVTDKSGKTIRSSEDKAFAGSGIKSIGVDAVTGQPQVEFTNNESLKYQADGVGLRYKSNGDGTAPSLIGFVRPDGSYVAKDSANVSDIKVSATGKVEVKYKDGTGEHFSDNGAKVITDASGNPKQSTSADGKTVVDYTYTNGALTGVVRTTTTDGKKESVKVEKEGDKFVESKLGADGKWAKTSNTYTSMSVYNDTAFMWDNVSKTSRAISSNGTEWEVRNVSDNKYTRLERDARGQVTMNQDTEGRITYFNRNANGELTGIRQNDDKLFKNTNGNWESSTNPGVEIKASVEIGSNGAQTWTDNVKPGNVRVVKPDGSVEITKPDLSKTIISSDGLSTRTIFAPGGDIQETTTWKSGAVEVRMRNGEVLQQSSYSDQISSSKNGTYTGSLEIAGDGTVTVFAENGNKADVYHPNGTKNSLEFIPPDNRSIDLVVHQQLKNSDLSAGQLKQISDDIKRSPAKAEQILAEAGIKDEGQIRAVLEGLEKVSVWRDVQTDTFYNNLGELGAVGPYQRDNAFHMGDARLDSKLNRGMEYLKSSSVETGAVVSNGTGNTAGSGTGTGSGTGIGSGTGSGAGPGTGTGTAQGTVPGTKPGTPEGGVGRPPMGPEGTLEKPAESHVNTTIVNHAEAQVAAADLKGVTKADGTPLSDATIKDLSQKIAANPKDAANLLKAEGVSDDTAKALSEKIVKDLDKANDTASDDIIKSALLKNGVPADKVDALTEKINEHPDKINDILAAAGVKPAEIEAITGKIKSDSEALKVAADTIIPDVLKNSGLTSEQIKEATAKIKEDPSHAAEILATYGIKTPAANALENSINKEMRSFNAIRDGLEGNGVDKRVSAEIALQAYGNPSKVAGLLEQHNVNAAKAKALSEEISAAINSGTVKVSTDRVAPENQYKKNHVQENNVNARIPEGPSRSLSNADLESQRQAIRAQQEADRATSLKNEAERSREDAVSSRKDNFETVKRDPLEEKRVQKETENLKQRDQERLEKKERDELDQKQKQERYEREQREVEQREKLERDQREQREKLDRDLKTQKDEQARREQREKLEKDQREQREKLERDIKEQRKELETRLEKQRQELLDRQKAQRDAKPPVGEKPANKPADRPDEKPVEGKKPDGNVVGRDTAGGVKADGSPATPGEVKPLPGQKTGDKLTSGDRTTDGAIDPDGKVVAPAAPGDQAPSKHDAASTPGRTETIDPKTGKVEVRDAAGNIVSGLDKGTSVVSGTKPEGTTAPAKPGEIAKPGETGKPGDASKPSTGAPDSPVTVARDAAGNPIKVGETKQDGAKADASDITGKIDPKLDSTAKDQKTDTTSSDGKQNEPATPVVGAPPVSSDRPVEASPAAGQAPIGVTTDGTLNRDTATGKITAPGEKMSSEVKTGNIDAATPAPLVPPGTAPAAGTAGTTTTPQTPPPSSEPAAPAAPVAPGSTSTPAPAQNPQTPATGNGTAPDPLLKQGSPDPQSGPVVTAPTAGGTTPTTPATTPNPASTTTQEPPAGQAVSAGQAPVQPGQNPPAPATQTGTTPQDPLQKQGSTDPHNGPVVTAPAGGTTPTTPGTSQNPSGTVGQEPPSGQAQPAGQNPPVTPAQTGQAGQTTPASQTGSPTPDPLQKPVSTDPQSGSATAPTTPTTTGTTPNPPGTTAQEPPTGQTLPGTPPAGQTVPAGQTAPAGQTPPAGQQTPTSGSDPNLPKPADPNNGTAPTVPGTQGQTTPGQSTTTNGQTTPTQEPAQVPAGQSPANTPAGQTPPTGATQVPTTGQGQGTTTTDPNLPKPSDPNTGTTNQLPTTGQGQTNTSPSGQTTTTPTGTEPAQNPTGQLPTGQTGTGATNGTNNGTTPGTTEPGQTGTQLPTGQTGTHPAGAGTATGTTTGTSDPGTTLPKGQTDPSNTTSQMPGQTGTLPVTSTTGTAGTTGTTGTTGLSGTAGTPGPAVTPAVTPGPTTAPTGSAGATPQGSPSVQLPAADPNASVVATGTTGAAAHTGTSATSQTAAVDPNNGSITPATANTAGTTAAGTHLPNSAANGSINIDPNQAATAALISTMLSNFSLQQSSPSVSQQPRPSVDPGTVTLSSAPAVQSTYSNTQPTTYSSPTYSSQPSSTTSNTDPIPATTSNYSNSSSSNSTSSQTVSITPAPQTATAPTSEPVQYTLPTVSITTQSSHPQPTSTQAEPPAHQAKPASEPTTAATQHQSTSEHTTSNTTIPVSASNNEDRDNNSAASSAAAPATAADPDKSSATNSDPLNSNTQTTQHHAVSQPATSTSSPNVTAHSQPVATNSQGAATQLDSKAAAQDVTENASAHANAAANRTQTVITNHATSTVSELPANTQSKPASQNQTTGAPQQAQRQHASPSSHGSNPGSGSAGNQQPAPATTATGTTGGSGTATTTSTPTAAQTDPTATTTANAQTGTVSTATTATGTSKDQSAQDPSQDPTSSTQNPTVSVPSQDPTAAQDPSAATATQDPSTSQDPTAQDPTVQDPTAQAPTVQDPTAQEPPQDPTAKTQEQIAQEQAQAQEAREQAARDQAARDQIALEQESWKQADWNQATKDQFAQDELRQQEIRDQATRDAVIEQTAQAARDQAIFDQAIREQEQQSARDQAIFDQAIREQELAQTTQDFSVDQTASDSWTQQITTDNDYSQTSQYDVDSSRVTEMPDGTVLVSFGDGVSAWTSADNTVTILDAEGQLTKVDGRITVDQETGHAFIYDVNDKIIDPTAVNNDTVYSSSEATAEFQSLNSSTIAPLGTTPSIAGDLVSAPLSFDVPTDTTDGAITPEPTPLQGPINPTIDFVPQPAETVPSDSIPTTDGVISAPLDGVPGVGQPVDQSVVLDQTNPVAGLPIDPISGLPYDPETGMLLDPQTGLPIGTFDPMQDQPIHQLGQHSKHNGLQAGHGIGSDMSLEIPLSEAAAPVFVDFNNNNSDAGNFDPAQIDGTRIDTTEFGGKASPEVGTRNLVDLLSDEITRIHDNIESRLEELVNAARSNGAFSQDNAAADVSSRNGDVDSVADDEHKKVLKDDDDHRREEEERLKKRKEEIKKLADTMQAVIATSRRDEMERVRKLLEQQRKIEEFVAQDTRQVKYTVRYDDTLESIAKKMFKDPRVAHLIYDLNKPRITAVKVDGKLVYTVKPGTVLTLPSPRQAREYVNRGKYMQAGQKVADVSSDAMSAEEKAELDERRKNVESVLGVIGARSGDSINQYNVRLGDSLRSIAMKHPLLNDVSLWRLLAEKNDLPTTVDSHGIPTAVLKRGSKLEMPNKQEIADFRKKIGVLTNPISTWITDSSRTGPDSTRTSKKCGDCKRQAPVGVAICPSCGFIFPPVQSRPVRTVLTVIDKTAKAKAGIDTKQDEPITDSPRKSGVKTDDQEAILPTSELIADKKANSLTDTADDLKVIELPQVSIKARDEKDSVKTGEDKPYISLGGVETTEEADRTVFVARTAEDNGVSTTEDDRTVFVAKVAADNGVPTTEEEDRTVFVPRTAESNGVPTTEDEQTVRVERRISSAGSQLEATQDLTPVASSRPSSKDVITAKLPDENDTVAIPPRQPIPSEISASQQLIDGISYLHDRDNKKAASTPLSSPVSSPPSGGYSTGGVKTGDPLSETGDHVQVQRIVEDLSENCRLVQLETVSTTTNQKTTRLQLETRKDNEWVAVIAYELGTQRSVRHVFSLNGKPKSMRMDLPCAALEAMVQNDFTKNWKSYIEKFLAGKKISA